MSESNPVNESRSIEEFWRLQTDPVFQGEGVAHGTGEAVLLIPGLFANDLYMQTAHTWLTRIGYRPVASEILWNVGCPKRILQSLVEVVTNRLSQEPTFSIVGHSRGGLLAKAITNRFGDRVRRLVLVGSPLGGMLAAGRDGMQQYAAFMQQDGSETGRQWVFNAGRAMTQMIDPDCKSPACDCVYMDDLFAPIPEQVGVTSIFSISDPIVPAGSSVVGGAENIRVDGSHSGLMFNKDVYPHIASALAG